MRRLDLGQTINSIANVGVIVGIVFLVVEINQSNRISSYSAEHSRRNQFIEINSNRIENADVYSKLQSNDVELTPPERAQALMMSRQLLNTWQDAESAYSYGLLSDRTFAVTLLDIEVSVEEAPGLLPFMAYLVEVYDFESNSSQVADRVIEIVRENGY